MISPIVPTRRSYQTAFLLLLTLWVVVAVRPTKRNEQQQDQTTTSSNNNDLQEFLRTLAAVGAAPNAPPNSSSTGISAFGSTNSRLLRGLMHGPPTTKNGAKCETPAVKELAEFPQWQDEVGYWIGDYTLLGGNGEYRVSASWPYPYDKYTGFITGDIAGGSYRQRNVFLYDHNTQERCDEIQAINDSNGEEDDDLPLVAGPGEGECGVNGNSLVFSADQSGCGRDGSISGSFQIGAFPIDTTTELIGADNALLYQVFGGGALIQSQLTTIHEDGERRTRTAQSFQPGSGNPDRGTSYYRERKVEKAEFYAELAAKIAEYNILDADLCTKDGFTRAEIYDQGGFEACEQHLEQSFELN